MEEMQGYETSGEIEQSAAETEIQEVETTAEQVEEVAADEQAEVEQEQPQPQNDRVEIAFAKRLAAEREKLQRELQDQFHQQYAPVLELAHQEAQKYGLDPVSWARAVQQNAERQYYAQLQEQGIDPSIIQNHPAFQRMKQYEQQLHAKEQEMTTKERFNHEANELFSEFPDLDAKKIPPEVFELRDKKGLSLLDAYLRVNHKRMLEETKVKTEQEVVKKLSKNATASPGSLAGAGEVPNSKVSALSKSDFASLLEKVKRGEIKNL